MKCEICGKEIDHSSYLDAELCSSSECYTAHFWLEIIKENKKDERHFLVDETVVAIEDENRYGERGFEGSLHILKLEDGTIFKTTNMWSNGECPKAFREFFRKASFCSKLEEVDLNKIKTWRELYDKYVEVAK